MQLRWRQPPRRGQLGSLSKKKVLKGLKSIDKIHPNLLSYENYLTHNSK